MEKALLTEVKAILRSLVISCPEKITVEQLNRDYRNVEGQSIPYRQLGYANLEQFLHSIQDTLRVFGSGPSAMVCFVANEKSDHIHNMIMKQKKPKSKSRSRSKSLRHNKSNRISTNTQQPPKSGSQQLSSYQSVNRNYMTKTVQVRNVPYLMQPVNYVPAVLSNQTLYSLPQPNGILLNPQQCLNYQFNPILSSVQNGVVKAIGNQAIQHQIQANQLSNLLTKQCNVTKPPPQLLEDRTRRNVRFIKEKETCIEVVEDIKKESQRKETTETKLSIAKSMPETSESPSKIKSSTIKKEMPVKLSEEVESVLTMPKLSNIQNSTEDMNRNSRCKEIQKEDSNENVNPSIATKTTQPKKFFDDTADSFEDPDEAIPSFAAKNNVFRLDFPEHTVTYGNKIAPYKLTEDITVGSCIKIFITEIHNPFKFWFHIHKDDHELDSLMYEIEHYYSTLDSEDLRIPMICLTPGQVCAACYKGLWHRAEVVAPPVNKSIKVSFMDYGTVTEVEIENVKFLHSYFAKFPAQALRGCLSHIKPRDLHWSHDATFYFLTLVAELLLYAKITEINREKNILYMILCDTNGDEVVQINSALVENRHASFNEEWKTDKITKNGGKRVRQPREDFPTFSMIESGEYPSFPELVSLQQRGIDYEAIYDRIIYNQSSILNKHESASEGLQNLPYFLTTSNPFRKEIILELHATSAKA